MQCKTLQEWYADPARWLRNGLYAEKDENNNYFRACPFGAVSIIYPNNYYYIHMQMREYLRITKEIHIPFTVWNDTKATIEDIREMCKFLEI